MNDEEHSWREIDLGGDAKVTVSLSGNLLNANSRGLDFLVRLVQLLDEAWSDSPGEVAPS